MARSPAVLIFDGYAALQGEHPHLLDFIGRDPLAPLLDQLVRPYVGLHDDACNPALFRQTRIVVLGNRGLDEAMRGASQGLNPYVARIVEYPGPQYTELARLVSLLDVDRRAEPVLATADLVEALNGRADNMAVSDASVRLTWGVANLHHAIKGARADLHWLAELLVQAGHLPRRRVELSIEVLCRAICDLLRAGGHLHAWHALAFIALDPGGLRAATLRRLMSIRYAAADGALALTRDGLNATVEFLIEGLPGILVRIEESSREDLHGIDRETEYDPAVWGDAWRDDPRSHERKVVYDIPAPDVRAAIRAAIRVSEPEEVCRVQRLLAEEALQQHTILARHGALGRDDGIRSQERLVEAIYHGLMSLPSRHRSTGQVAGRERDPLGGRTCFPPPKSAGLLPEDSGQRLRVLYADLYRNRLERRPQWALTRSWEAIHLKQDMLRDVPRPDGIPYRRWRGYLP